MEVDLLKVLPISTSPGSYTVTIGAGGGAGIEATQRGGDGGPTTFGSIVSQGGGGGGSDSTNRIDQEILVVLVVVVHRRAAGPEVCSGGTANRETGTTNPAPTQGYAGGSGYNSGYESKEGRRRRFGGWL